MDKNVSGVDLEELKKAREELDRERGVESDPNMYNDYNPNREEIQLENSNASDSAESEVNELNSSEASSDKVQEDEGLSEENLSKFSAFSAFEVKDDTVPSAQPAPEPEKPTPLPESKNKHELDDLLNELLEDMDTEEFDTSDVENNEIKDTEEINSEDDFNNDFNTSIDIEPKFDEDEKVEIMEDSEETLEQTENISEESEDLDNAKETSVDELEESVAEPEESNKVLENVSSKETANPQTSDEDLDIITDFNQLKEILQNELKESENAEKEKQAEAEEKKIISSKYQIIEDFKFINEITTDEFKNTDKLSYIMGKNEKAETIFGNFKEHFNLAVFGKNDLITNSFLNSMILSLCLKNSYHDVNFVLLDSNIDSSFEVYNKSSYLYFNRIAKTNKEIADTLIEIAKEIDNRYDKMAELGVKTVEGYNEGAVSGGFSTMPYIIVVFNNYTSASQATDKDKINTCLYQILKFGRIAGVYCVVTAKLPIESNQVNYNLSSRISFKSDEDSRFTIGEKGAEDLPEESDALYYNISNGKITHIKSAMVNDTELDLIIKDLED